MAEALGERAKRVYEKYGTVMVNLEGFSQVGEGGWCHVWRIVWGGVQRCWAATGGLLAGGSRRGVLQGLLIVLLAGVPCLGPRGSRSVCGRVQLITPCPRLLCFAPVVQAGIERQASARNLFMKLLSMVGLRGCLCLRLCVAEHTGSTWAK